MASRWFNLLLGVLLIQGYLAFSPIRDGAPDESFDEEWVEYNEMMRDPAYRLPTTTRPSHYAVTLTPYFDNVAEAQRFTFDGQVAITIQATQANVNEIVLHCNDLTILTLTVHAATNLNTNLAATGQTFTCQMPYSFLRIATTTPLDVNQQYIITSTFRGNLQTNMRGFYRSWYHDGTARRWMATTQFQPGHARQAFPCYDEPGFKARFDITIVREEGFKPTLSNMPIRTTGAPANGRVAETFYTTPLTSTYLLAFIVSHYDRVATGTNAQRPFHIYARTNAGSTGDFSLEIGEKLLAEMESYTGYPYYTMTDNIIMQQAAIPDFSAGAMENWGLLTYREALILYDPQHSNHFYRQRVANIVAHEIAHMWFGNLVTCAWWDNLWLNEGFARFYQYYLTGAVAPEMGYATRFIVEQEQTALLSDSFQSAHALTDPSVNDPTTVSAHFSTITYAKGAAVLRMTQHLLSDTTYRKALQNYLAKNAFSVAEPQDLFSVLDEAAAADNAMAAYGGITVEQYMKTWSEQAGHPLLTVAVDHNTGRMTVTQERFNIVNGGVSPIRSLWHVPITWTRGLNVDFDDLKPSQILTGASTTIDRGTTGREWVIFNKQQSGFYRVNYDATTWALITQALRASATRQQIHEYNRAQIIDDVFIMARSGLLPYARALNIISFLEFEDQYAPWIAAITGFNFARRRLAHNDANLGRLEALIIESSKAITARLGFAETATDTYMDGLLRMYVNTFLCNVGHEQCVAAGRASFANWRNSASSINNIPANMRPWVYCTGLRHGDAADFTFFWNRYVAEDLASEKIVMLQAAGCTNDEASLQAFLNAITAGDDDDTIRPQDYSTALSSAITSNEVNTMRAFNWLTNNVARTTAALGSISSPLSTITGRLLTEAQITQVSAWLEANQATIGTAAYNAGVSGIATARANIQWYSQRATEFETYFETGYVEETFEDDVTTPAPTTPGETTDATTAAPGAANINAIGFITLIVTLAINMA
ncbi:membrane alanyl aminopeptidase-like [Anticarsia gemmatalis]|uniref:membrane alanyl aminopeptidase-like n=1 Tax=Anticarsia gemmatalis TaxID=129554 RepID=UPI003F760C0F